MIKFTKVILNKKEQKVAEVKWTNEQLQAIQEKIQTY